MVDAGSPGRTAGCRISPQTPLQDYRFPRPQIGSLSQESMATTEAYLNCLTKPRGSLGRLESLAVHLSGITGQMIPALRPSTVVVMAADHGVTAEGISAYPQEVTVQMISNFLQGGAAISVLARLFDLGLRIVDIGVAGDLGSVSAASGEGPRCDLRRVRSGTGNMVSEAAMSVDEARKAIQVGIDIAADETDSGTRVICLGEMGIGNTTASSAILAALTGSDPARVVGPGTGVDREGRLRKADVIRRAMVRHRLTPGSDPLQILSSVGGLEIAGLVGVILGAAHARRPVVLDGFITGAAALVASRLEPRATAFMMASHRSCEPAHGLMLDLLGLSPLLDLDLRLGEGTGAALAFSLLEAAAAIVSDMSTFEGAGVSESLDSGDESENDTDQRC